MAESDIRKTERPEKAARKHGEISGHKTTHGHTHHSQKGSPEHDHHNEHQQDRKKGRMNMKARLVPVLIALATSVITIDARAAIADISNTPAISRVSKITPLKSTALTIRANRIQIKERINESIGSADKIDYANISDSGIVIEARTIALLDNSIRAIASNDIDIIRDISNVDDGNGINTIAIRSITSEDSVAIAGVTNE